MPDKTILKDLVEGAANNIDCPNFYLDWIERIFTYVFQYDDFIALNTNAAYVLRQVAKYVEFLICQFMEESSIDTEKAFILCGAVSNALTMTSHVASFDVDTLDAELSDILNIIPEAE